MPCRYWNEICYKILSSKMIYSFNSLWPSDAILRHRSESTLVEVMACCLMATSHYLNQLWLIIIEVFWYSPKGNFTRNAQDIFPGYEFERYYQISQGASELTQAPHIYIHCSVWPSTCTLLTTKSDVNFEILLGYQRVWISLNDIILDIWHNLVKSV